MAYLTDQSIGHAKYTLRMRLETIFEQGALDPAAQGMGEPAEAPEGLQTQPLAASPDNEAGELPPEPEEGGEDAMMPKDDSGKAEGGIDAIEKLRSAAAGLDAAAFSMKTDYSDFTLAERIEQVKQELIYIINKAKEHVEYSAAKDPQAKQRVSQWLNT